MTIDYDESVMEDVRARLGRVRRASHDAFETSDEWAYGMSTSAREWFVRYWATRFSWEDAVAKMNAMGDHGNTVIQGRWIWRALATRDCLRHSCVGEKGGGWHLLCLGDLYVYLFPPPRPDPSFPGVAPATDRDPTSFRCAGGRPAKVPKRRRPCTGAVCSRVAGKLLRVSQGGADGHRFAWQCVARSGIQLFHLFLVFTQDDQQPAFHAA